jgi:hypothetical protein
LLSPPDDGSIPAAEYDKAQLELSPHITDIGDTIAEDLETYAGQIAAGEAISPTFKVGG